jgi:hypothetical protein
MPSRSSNAVLSARPAAAARSRAACSPSSEVVMPVTCAPASEAIRQAGAPVPQPTSKTSLVPSIREASSINSVSRPVASASSSSPASKTP